VGPNKKRGRSAGGLKHPPLLGLIDPLLECGVILQVNGVYNFILLPGDSKFHKRVGQRYCSVSNLDY
jgi:hypothetical protein